MKTKTLFTTLPLMMLLGFGVSTALADDAKEWQALERATLSATDAVKAAVNVQTGVAKEVEFDLKNGQAIYQVEIMHDGMEYKLNVDANQGKVTETGRKSMKKNNAPAKISLTDAIAKAESATGGKTKEAQYKSKYSPAYYEVTIIKDQIEKEVQINAETGAVDRIEIDD